MEHLRDWLKQKKGRMAWLARQLKITPVAIHYWFKRDKCRIPAAHVLAVELITGIPRHKLRPDLYPPASP